MSEHTPHPAVEHALGILRQYRSGALASDGVVHQRRFIIDPSDGALVLELTHQELDAAEHVMHVPDEQLPGASHTSLQLLLALEELDPDRAFVCDRFLAAHGARSLGRWARARIDSGKTSQHVISGEDLMAPNPVRAEEGGLLRTLNADRAALGRAVLAGAGVRVSEPTAVACDPRGFDVRGGVGVIRVEFDTPMRDASEIARAIDDLLGQTAP